MPVFLSGPYREKNYRLELQKLYIGGGAGSAQGLKQGCHGAHVPCTAAVGEQKQPLSLPITHFGSRVMEGPGEAGPFQWLWKVLPAGALSRPPPVAGAGDTRQGSGQKTRSIIQPGGAACLSTSGLL